MNKHEHGAINGKLYQKDSAAFEYAIIEFDNDSFNIQTSDRQVNNSGLTEQLHISSRIGNTDRKITLQDGSVFVTPHNDLIDQYTKKYQKRSQLLHQIESNMRFVLLGLVFTVLFCVGFIRWGIPAISVAIADSLPQSVNEVISKETLWLLDNILFEESRIPIEKQRQIEALFHDLVNDIDSGSEYINYKLYFRYWGIPDEEFGVANALALPSGEIIVTDTFVELASDPNELKAVLLHEIGHVKHKHGLKTVIQHTIFATLVTIALGDASGYADLGVGLGTLLVNAHYSRHYETSADQFAFTNMLKLNIDPQAFASIMHKMSEYMDSTSDKLEHQKHNDDVFDYLSSHPKTDDRVKQANKFKQCFDKNLTVCP